MTEKQKPAGRKRTKPPTMVSAGKIIKRVFSPTEARQIQTEADRIAACWAGGKDPWRK